MHGKQAQLDLRTEMFHSFIQSSARSAKYAEYGVLWLGRCKDKLVADLDCK